MAIASMPLLNQQMAAREFETIARRFIANVHFVRQQALVLGEMTRMPPITGITVGMFKAGINKQRDGLLRGLFIPFTLRVRENNL